ncbi:hypothetical protein K469DRAFT_688001 [Zopfia rhizophila CBS 207.26]|uniref:Rhodopsin domain-containing protein n=1 Tax=Zopfia rhizophila CBS 207.26 TaxID=1314779 RepID=A0A6A6E034_9PEZI|nr:hypothetical protein K469DRAFT_688001 [Zopfia rhizophila CBS 207.26]
MDMKSTPYYDYSINTYAVLSAFLFLIIASMLIRETCRHAQVREIKKAQRSFIVADYPAIDDHCAYLAFGFCIMLSILGFVSVIKLLPKFTAARAATYTFAIFFIKLSFLYFFHRTFTIRNKLEGWFRLAWYTDLSFNVLWLLVMIPLIVVHGVHASQTQYKDLDLIFGRVAGRANVSSDLFLLILPIKGTWDLKMPKKQKIGASVAYLFGLMATPTSGLQASAHEMAQMRDWSLANETYIQLTAISGESCVGLVCLCLPSVKQFFSNSGLKTGSTSSGPRSELPSKISAVPRRSSTNREDAGTDVELISPGPRA